MANLVPLLIDKDTGRIIAKEAAGGGTFAAVGFVHVQSIASNTWSINHGGATTSVLVQIYDNVNAPTNSLLPDEVIIVDANNITVTFAGPQIGRAHIILLQ